MKTFYLIILGALIQINAVAFNSGSSSNFMLANGPDLFVQDISQGVIKLKDGFPLRFIIGNQGNTSARVSQIKIVSFLNGSQFTSQTINLNVTFPANSSREMKISLPSDKALLGDWTFIITIDPNNLISEIDEYNNTINKNLRVELHDIKVTMDGSAAVFEGQTAKLNIKIENIGNVNSGKITVLLLGNNAQLELWNITNLSGGSSQIYSKSMNLTAGAYTYMVSLPSYSDDDNSNNYRTHIISVTKMPSLKSKSLSEGESTALDSDSIFSKIEILDLIPISSDNNDKTSEDLKIYPNPNNGIFQIYKSNRADDNTIDIFSENGAKLISQKLNSDIETIDLSAYPKGVYYLIYKNKEERIEKKITKSN